MKEFKTKPVKGIKSLDEYSLKKIASQENAELLHSNENFVEWARKGGNANIDNLINWCKENNHWDKLAEQQRGVPKSEEVKKKISKKLKGQVLSEETKKKMSESRMGHGWSDEAIENLKKAARKRMRPVLQYDLDGNFIKEWGGFAEIVDELKVSKSPIYACCKGNAKKAHGFIWKYKEGDV
jgi:hypothetical protein